MDGREVFVDCLIAETYAVMSSKSGYIGLINRESRDSEFLRDSRAVRAKQSRGGKVNNLWLETFDEMTDRKPWNSDRHVLFEIKAWHMLDRKSGVTSDHRFGVRSDDHSLVAVGLKEFQDSSHAIGDSIDGRVKGFSDNRDSHSSQDDLRKNPKLKV